MRLCSSFAIFATIATAGCSSQAPVSRPHVTLVDTIDVLGMLAREPMAAQHPGGALFVSGYGDTLPHLWKSLDQGRTWKEVHVGSPADGASGNSDVDLAVARDGTLYFITMNFDRTVLEGTRMQVGVSGDTGLTWRWHRLSQSRYDDRPWVEVEPSGRAHAIWNDGSGVAHAVSTDGGNTWTERNRVSPLGGSSHLAIGPQGQLAVRVSPLSASGNRFDEGVDQLFISTDGGETWRQRQLPGQTVWRAMKDTTVTPAKWDMGPQPRWVEPLAWDSTGALFSFWGHDGGTWLARSRDAGATWSTWRISTDSATTYFPYLIARGRGELVASWFVGVGDSLRARVALIEAGDGDQAPFVAPAGTFHPEAFAQTDGNSSAPLHRDTGGEYLGITWLAGGGFGVVAPIQNPGSNRMGFSFRRYSIKR